MVKLVMGPVSNAVMPFFEKYRILVTTRLSMEWGGSEQNSSHYFNPRGHISINSMFFKSSSMSIKLPGTPLSSRASR